MPAPTLNDNANGQSSAVTGDQFNTFEQTCNNVDDLRAFIGSAGVQVYMRGFDTSGDGGQGEFYWNSTGTGPDDNGITNIVPNGAVQGCWTRIFTNEFNPINVKDYPYDAIGNGIADDTDAIQRALDVGGTIYFPPGTYKITGAGVAGIANTELVFSAGVILDISGCDVLGPPNAAFSNQVCGLSFHGSIGNNISLASNAAAQQANVILSSVGGLSVEDWIYLSSNALFAASTKYGEFGQIKSINTGTNTVTLYDNLLLTYNTSDSARLQKLSFCENIKITGKAKILGGGIGTAQIGILFQYCHNYEVDGIWTDYTDNAGIQTYKSLKGNIDKGIFSRDRSVGLAYGVEAIYGTDDLTITNCTGYDLRHLVTANGDTSVGGVTTNIRAYNNIIYGARDAGFDAHEGCNIIDYSHNIIYNAAAISGSPGGLICQGANFTAIGNIGYQISGTGCFHQPICSGAVPLSTTMIGNKMYGIGAATNSEPAYYIQGSGTPGNITNATIEGNQYSGFTYGIFVYANVMNIYNCNIVGNSDSTIVSSTTTGGGITVRSNTGFVVDGGSVVNNITHTTGAQNIILLGADANGVKRMTIGGNTISGGTNGLRLDNADYLNIFPNFIYNTTTPIKLDTALTNSVVNFGQNSARSTADQSITSSTVLANSTYLSFPIQASEEWFGQFNLDVGAALTTTGIKLAVTVPSGATLNLIASMQPDTTTTAKNYTKRTTTSGTALDFTTTNLASVGDAQVIVSVWVLNSTNAGTVNLQFAQSSSSGTAVTIRKGSFLTANREA